eukprot:370602-Rhodomonas_salina.1
MVSRREKARSLEESDSDQETPRQSTGGISCGVSVDRTSDKQHTEEGASASTEASSTHMDRIEESMGDVSLLTPEGTKEGTATANPQSTAERGAEGNTRAEEIAKIQARLPFVPKHPFCMDGLSEDNKPVWLPNLLNPPAEDGSGSMTGLHLSQIVLMWGSIWESA